MTPNISLELNKKKETFAINKENVEILGLPEKNLKEKEYQEDEEIFKSQRFSKEKNEVRKSI